MQIRAGDSVGGVLDVTAEGMSARFAGDQFSISGQLKVSKTCSLVGMGYASELNTFVQGPMLTISANDVVIEGLRFVFSGSLPSSDLVTRPERCSGSSYSPAALSTSLHGCAVKVTGNNVTIRDCWFDGFDNAIYSTGKNTRVFGCHFKGGHDSTRAAVYLAGENGSIHGNYVDGMAYGAYVTGNTASLADNTMLTSETAIFVTSDYNRIHGNYCEGNSAGFAMVLTSAAQYNAVTGNVALPDKSKGTLFFITPATSKNQYGANIGEVDIG